MCIALAGTWHSLDEDFGSHPNCRCCPLPSLRNKASGDRTQNGSAWLAEQREAVKDKVLGKAGAKAYREGKFVLTDIVGEKDSEKWGRSYVRRSLKETLQAAESPRPLGIPPEGEQWAQAYTRPYVSPNGASVYAEENWEESTGGKELEIAKNIADNGIDVVLRKELSLVNRRTHDAYLNRNKGWEKWEFKRLTEKTINISGRIAASLLDGKEQASNILIYIDKVAATEDDINVGIRKAIQADLKQGIHNIGILFYDKILKFFPRRSNDDKIR